MPRRLTTEIVCQRRDAKPVPRDVSQSLAPSSCLSEALKRPKVTSRRDLSSAYGEHVLGEEALRAEAAAHAVEGAVVEACELPWSPEEETLRRAVTWVNDIEARSCL